LFIGLSLVALAPLFLKVDFGARIWVIVIFLFLGLAMIEHLTTLHLPISRFSQGMQPHLAYRPTAVFVNENNYAVFLSLSFPFLLARWRYFPNLWNRVCTGLGLLTGVYLLYVTGSRINYIILLISVFLYSWFLTSRGARLKVFSALMLLVLGTWMIFGLSLSAARGYMVTELVEIVRPFFKLVDLPEGGDYPVTNNSIAIRINMIRNGAQFIIQTWGAGVGVGNFEAWVQNFAVYNTNGFVNPHNWWIELATEYGLIVALGYLALFGRLLWAAWLGWQRTTGRDKWVPEAICLALAVFPLAGVSPSSMLVYLPHWILLALALAWQQHAIKAGE